MSKARMREDDWSLRNKVQDANDTGSNDAGQDNIVPVFPGLDLANQLTDTRQLRRHVVDPLIDAQQSGALSIQIILSGICLPKISESDKMLWSVLCL